MRLRIWGVPVVRYLHLSGPDDVPARRAAPAPTMTGDHTVDPDGPPIDPDEEDVIPASEPAVIERLDVPPERRPWDTARPTIPPTGTSEPPHPPHCSGRHAIKEGLARCEYCDVLTGAVSLARSLEKRVAELEKRLYALDGVAR